MPQKARALSPCRGALGLYEAKHFVGSRFRVTRELSCCLTRTLNVAYAQNSINFRRHSTLATNLQASKASHCYDIFLLLGLIYSESHLPCQQIFGTLIPATPKTPPT